MNKYTRLAKKYGFDHEYEYRSYVKAKCKGKLGEFYLNTCCRSLVKANRHFESVMRGLWEALFNCLAPCEYIDRDYIIHVDTAPKPDVIVPPVEIIPYGTHVHTGKSWIWLNMLIEEERAKYRDESSGQSS